MAETIQAETRKLAAIMFTDIVGFSRQMGAECKAACCGCLRFIIRAALRKAGLK